MADKEMKVYTIRSHVKYMKNNNGMKAGVTVVPIFHAMTLRTREIKCPKIYELLRDRAPGFEPRKSV